jgi:hypothetical protein
MDITIDNEKLQEAINNKISKAVEEALGGYEVKSAVANKITESFAHGVIGEAMDKAIASMDVVALTSSLANEIAKATTRAAIHCLTDGLVKTLLAIRNIPDYEREKYEHARLEITAMLTREAHGTQTD